MRLKIFIFLFVGIVSSEASDQIVFPGDKYFTNVDFDSLQKVFLNLNDHDRRYFLESLPKYFSENKIQVVPEWIKAAAINALALYDQQLVMRAIYVSGKLRIEESVPVLTGLYRTIRYKFGTNDSLLRESISSALVTIDPYKASVSLSDLLSHPPRFKPDIIQAVKVIGAVSSSEIIPSIDEFLLVMEDEIRSDSIENIKQKKEPEDLIKDNEYKNALSLTKKLKADILTREGRHE